MDEREKTLIQRRKATFCKATSKYKKENLDEIKLRVPKGFKDEVLKKHVMKTGESMNSFLIRAVKETISRDENATGTRFVLPRKAVDAFAALGITEPEDVRDYMLYGYGKRDASGRRELSNVGKKTADQVVEELYRCGYLDEEKRDAALRNVSVSWQLLR